jgi:hypothetical protein
MIDSSHLTCLFPRCANGCQGHVLPPAERTGQLLGTTMGAGLVRKAPDEMRPLAWHDVVTNGRSSHAHIGLGD